MSLLIGNLSASAQPKKVIIDTDPGVEDAMELVGAMQYPGIEILGITTISSRSTKNALRVVERLGKNIPVFQGASRALFGPSLREGPDFVNGDDGLGNTNQPEPKIKVQQKPAAQFIVEMAKTYPGQITILALARLTNLADAIRLDSSVIHNIREVVVVAGALRVPGLASPVAEPNIWMDPHAADMVYTAPWKVTMLGLDVTMKITISDTILLGIKNENPKYGPFIYSISRFTRDFQMKALQIDGFRDFGAAAILYMVDSSLFKFRKGPVRVVTEGMAMGQTIMPALEFQLQLDSGVPWRGKPFVSAAFDVDVERYLKYYEAIMKGKQK